MSDDAFTIWTEKYRPDTFDEIIGHEEIVRRVRSLTEQENLPHLLFAGPPGVGKCVTGDTPVLTANGSVTPIDCLEEDGVESVLSLDERGELTEKPIAYFHEEHADTTYNVTTSSGASITVTPEHPFLSLENGVPTWTEAADLQPGMPVAAPNTFTVADPAPFLPTYDLTEEERQRASYLTGALTESIDDAPHYIIAQLNHILDTAIRSRSDLPAELQHLVSHEEALSHANTLRDKRTRQFLDGYTAHNATHEDDVITYTTPEPAQEQLSYLLQRHGIRPACDGNISVSGRDKAKLESLMSSISRSDAEDEPRIPLATEHLERVMESLGIDTYTFDEDIRGAIEHGEDVPETQAKYIYTRVKEQAKERLNDAVQFLDRTEGLADNEDAYSVVTLSSREEERRRVLDGHISAYRELQRGDLAPAIGDTARALQRVHRHDDNLYSERLAQRGLAHATSDAIQTFNVSEQHIRDEAGKTPVQVTQDAQTGVVSARTMRHLHGVAMTTRRVLEDRIYNDEFLRSYELISYLSQAQLTWDTVETVEEAGEQTVYDLNVEDTHNFVAGNIPIINHNTTMSLVIAKELYGDSWQQNFLELNASDERGIDVVREKVKDFARTQSLGDVPFKIIYLDEADSLTSDAQQALRRTMESYTRSCRFILSCNYSSKIIDPIQSRCTVFRFRGLDDTAVNKLIDRIADAEGLDITDDGRDALLYASDGDLRRLENMLQTSASITDTIEPDTVYSVAAYTDPEDVKEILGKAVNGSFDDAKEQLLKAMLSQGLSGPDVIKQFQREIWDLDISDERKLDMIKACGEAEFRLIEGSDEHIQLDALLAEFARQD